jgi:hypothetical protein
MCAFYHDKSKYNALELDDGIPLDGLMTTQQEQGRIV